MNNVESEVLKWITSRNLNYTKTETGFQLDDFHIKCVTNNQSVPIYKEPNDRIVAEWDLHNHIAKLSEWCNGYSIMRIEKLDIQLVETDNRVFIKGYNNTNLICEVELHKRKDFLFWAHTKYYGYHVPGWLSKCVKIIERSKITKSIEVLTNAINGSYQRIGFKVLYQTDIREYNKEMNYKMMPYEHPENILIWRLRYDCQFAI